MAKKTFKIKFATKKDKEIFVKATSFENEDQILDNSKKKSVKVAAENKDSVRMMIERAEHGSYHLGDGYCFGEKGEDYTIEKE